MTKITSDESGVIIEQPQASEVFERLKEPEQKVSLHGADYDKVMRWRARIAVARKIRDRKLKHLNKYIDFYEGNQWHDDGGMPIFKDRTTVNLIFANIKKELPYLYFQNPTPIVNPTRNEFELGAFAMQELLKSYTKFNLGTELKKHVRLTILDAKFSFGCLKVTYTPRFSPNPNKGKPTVVGTDDFNEPIFLQDDDNNYVTESDAILTSEFYFVERISPREMLFDPECRNFIDRAGWVAQELVKPLKYLKENKLYKNTEFLNRNVELADMFKHGLGNKSSEEVSAAGELYGEDNHKVRFVEIYDFVNNELLVLPDDNAFFIREENIYMNPFSFLKFNESPDNWYPVPDIKIEMPLQQEVNVGRSMMITHARRSARKYYYSSETFRGLDKAIEDAKNPEDMSFFEIAEYDKPPMPLGMAAQDPMIFQNLIQSKMDYNEVTGSTEASRGVTEKRKTKGEAGFQESHGAVRRGDKQNLVADFIVDTYENLAKLMQSTLTVPQAMKITGPAGVFWTQVEHKDITGIEFKLEIEVSELRPQIPEIDRKELSEFIFALSNILNALVSNPILLQIFEVQGLVGEFAKSYPSINVEKILNMKVTPEQIAEMVMAQLNQGGEGATK